MKNVVLAGAPSSGKSSFVAALSHLLNSGELVTTLSLTRLSDDEQHSSLLQERWLDAELVDRTKKQTESWVTFHIEQTATEPRISGALVVPDLRGELFIQPATMGVCDRSLFSALQTSSAILLFTSAESPIDDVAICDINGIADPEPNSQREGMGAQHNPFVPDNIPEQVKLVELLQAINRKRGQATTRRLAIIVSAWDVVHAASANSDADAEHWIELNRPMLHQFLVSNADLWDVEYFGVSALGGVLPRDAERFKKMTKQSSRIMVSSKGTLTHDLTSIIAWAIHEKA